MYKSASFYSSNRARSRLAICLVKHDSFYLSRHATSWFYLPGYVRTSTTSGLIKYCTYLLGGRPHASCNTLVWLHAVYWSTCLPRTAKYATVSKFRAPLVTCTPVPFDSKVLCHAINVPVPRVLPRTVLYHLCDCVQSRGQLTGHDSGLKWMLVKIWMVCE